MKIKGLNIVRTLGVVLVLLYHFFPMLLKGGFFGVDVFFVASGYLITALLIQDFRDGGGIRLLDFYKRRLLRLLPALILMLIAVIPFTLLISPDFRVGMYKQAVAAVAFFTNYYEISIGQSYENQLLPHLFVHTWSLAAEMQFYLFWGALASAALVLARRIKQGLEHGGSGFVLALAVILAVASYVRMQLGVDGDYDMSAAYYSAISHFFPFMIGSVAGIIFGFSLPGKIKELMRGKKLAFLSCILSIISVVGIAMLSAVLSFSDEATYRFGFLAVSLMSAVLISSIRILHEYGWIKEPGIIRFIGTRSYGIYLFHWPIYIITSQLMGMDRNIYAVAVSLAVTVILAQISYRFVEEKFRVHRFDGPKTRNISIYKRLATVTLSMVLLSASIFALRSAPLKTSIEEDLEYELRILTEKNNEGITSAIRNERDNTGVVQ